MTHARATKTQALRGVTVGWLLVVIGCAVAVTGFATALLSVGITGFAVGIAGSIVVAVTLRRRSVR